MSITQRRNSQRLASTLDALSADLDFDASEVEVETDENITGSEQTPDEYWEGKAKGDEAIQLLGQDDQDSQVAQDDQDSQVAQDDQDDQFEQAFQAAMDEEEEDVESSILQGDPGVKEVGSQATYDTNSVCGLGSEYGVDFDGDQNLQDSIRNVPGRTEKQARIKKLIARIENVANELEATGRKALAYRLDIVCNHLEAKYLNK